LAIIIAKIEAKVNRRDIRTRRKVRLSSNQVNFLLNLIKRQQAEVKAERQRLVDKIRADREFLAKKERDRFSQLRHLGRATGLARAEIRAVIQANERVLMIRQRSISTSEEELLKLAEQLKKVVELRQILSLERGGEGHGDREGSEQQLVRS
jgi:hypothetical protein